jgi:hypothetical protein
MRHAVIWRGPGVDLCSFKLAFAAPAMANSLGHEAFFFKYLFGDVQLLGQLLPRCLLTFQSALEALNDGA